jgi:hypothetical protein
MASNDTESAKGLLEIVRTIALKVFKAKVSNDNLVASCLATVVETTESDEVMVRLLSSPDDGSKDFKARNKTGEPLVDGDSVWLHYWGGTYTNAYIAIRNWAS